MALTPKQAAFVREYLLDLNATQAAIRAGYSPKSAEVQGPRLLGNAGVRAAINSGVEKRAQRLEIKADDVLRELLRIATSDIGEAFAADGKLKPIHEIPEATRRAMSGLETDELWAPVGDAEGRAHIGDTRKVKFWDKTRALELLAKHLKLLTDKVDASGTVEVVIRTVTG